MASGWYNIGLLSVMNGTIDVDGTTLKIMLVDDGYVFDPDEDVVSTALSSAEVVCTNYTGGYGGGGRQSVTGTLQVDDVNDEVDIAISSVSWSSLGGAANDTIGGAALIYETGGADTSSIPVAFFDLPNWTTNSNGLSLNFELVASGGNLQVTSTGLLGYVLDA